jgi:hypothetical protein
MGYPSSTLFLLVLGVLANDAYYPVPFDDLAFIANALDAGSDFHAFLHAPTNGLFTTI